MAGDPLTRVLAIVVSLALAGCASHPDSTVQWRGHTEGRIKASVAYSGATLPAQGWLVESERDQAIGVVSFTKWGSGTYRYKKRAYFQVRDKWEPEVVYLGRFETKDGSNEFCAVNPEHGGYQEGDSIVITNSYDYCARLTRE